MHPAGVFFFAQLRNYIILRTDQGPKGYETVNHEFYHFLTSRYFATLPLWLVEGMADFYARAEIYKDVVNIGVADLDLLLQLKSNSLLPLNVLFKVDHSSPYYNEKERANIFYAESWALTHYLLLADNQTHRAQLADYLRRISRGEAPDAAGTAAFGDLARLQNALSGYIGNASMHYLTIPAPKTSDQEFHVRTLAPAESAALLGGAFACRHRPADARRMTEEALRLDANLGVAHQSLGLVEMADGHLDAAMLAFGDAVRLDPNDYYSHYFHAHLLAFLNPANEAQTMESDLEQALKLNPDFVPTYVDLVNLYLYESVKLPEALALAQKANHFDPNSTYNQILVGRVALQMGRTSDAMDVAQRAVAGAVQDADRAQAERFLQLVDRARGELPESAPGNTSSAAPLTAAPATPPQEQTIAAAKPPEKRAKASGPPTSALGTITAASCGGPALSLTLDLEGSTLSLHADQVAKIEFIIEGWNPPKDFSPCRDLRNLHAKIKYTPVAGKSYAGEISAIEIHP